jgi:hypothetical protein
MKKDIKKNEIVLKQDRICGSDFWVIPMPFSVDEFQGNAVRQEFIISYTFPVNDKENDSVSFFDWFHIIDDNKNFFDVRWDYDKHTVTVFFEMRKITQAEDLIKAMINVGIIAEPKPSVKEEKDTD